MIELTFGDEYIPSYNETKEKKNDSIPLIIKYIPMKLDDIVSQKNIISNISNFIKLGTIPNLLFYGLPGTGKTSTITAIIEMLYGKNKNYMAMELNSSSERGIEIVRKDIRTFATMDSLINIDKLKYKKKMIILDEVDSMTKDAQQILRKICEDNIKNVSFCLICNEINQVIPSIQSRCLAYKFGLINPVDMNTVIKKICEIEKIKYEDDSIEIICDNSNGDFRNGLNTLQLLCSGNKGLITKEYAIKYSRTSIKDLIKSIVYQVNKVSLNELFIYVSTAVFTNMINMSLLIDELAEYIFANGLILNNISFLLIQLKDLDKEITEEQSSKIHIMCFVSLLYKVFN